MADISRLAADYWDENREKANDPTFWMAHPRCREAINRRVTGDPHEWPIDGVRRVHVRRALPRGLSFGCGLGALERALVRSGVVAEIDAFDISEASLEDARRLAEADGLSGIAYRIADFNHPRIERGRYDIAFFHQSLHHVVELERLVRRLASALKPGALLYVDEYVGPSRTDWTTAHVAGAQLALDLMPDEAKLAQHLLPPIEPNDPSEAIRSSEIVPLLRRAFEVVAWRPYGGQRVDLVLPVVRHAWSTSEEGETFIARLLGAEDRQLRRAPASTHYLVALLRGKSLARLIPAFMLPSRRPAGEGR